MGDGGRSGAQQGRRAGRPRGCRREPDSATQCRGCLRTSAMALAQAAGVPSVSSARCCTGRPRMPPRALRSCQAAREPIRKSRRDVVLARIDQSAIWAMGPGAARSGRRRPEARGRSASQGSRIAARTPVAPSGGVGEGARAGGVVGEDGRVLLLRPDGGSEKAEL